MHGRRTDEVTTRTGLLVNKMARNGEATVPQKPVDIIDRSGPNPKNDSTNPLPLAKSRPE
jgi:hypothetical protein